MAELKFKGKKMVWNHHLSVPYHTLESDEKLSYKKAEANGNLIIEGDNLIALKSILPEFSDKIDIIYSDPPYNTGEEGWTYNDNVNSPLIAEWIGKEVGADDLTRHDKWLCMMTPRIKLLRSLLKDTGVIIVSADDNEIHTLRMLMDEIFGESNFIANTIRVSNAAKNNVNNISVVHEYSLVYAKDKELVSKDWEVKKQNSEEFEKFARRLHRQGLSQDEIEAELKVLTKYPRFYEFDHFYYCDKKGVYQTDNPGGVKNGNRESEIIHPETKVACKKPSGGWRYNQDTINEMIEENRWHFGEDEHTIPRVKRYLLECLYSKPTSIHYFDSQSDTKWLKKNNLDFDFPKPVNYIKYFLSMILNPNALVLDAFAGSGTTAQAVLELNEEDEGNRKFVMIQMPEAYEKEPDKNICRDVTRERVIKVIENRLEQTNLGFNYKRVGQPIDADTILSGNLPTYEQLAKYVFYLATGQTPNEEKIDSTSYLAGSIEDTSVYLIYQESLEELQGLALTYDFAKELPKGKKIVYAPACFLDDDYLTDNDIRFVSIPYNLFERVD